MLKYILDNIVKQDNKIIAYIHIMDGQKVVKNVSLCYKNEEDFKKVLKIKTANIKAEHEEKEAKIAEIERILEVM